MVTPICSQILTTDKARKFISCPLFWEYLLNTSIPGETLAWLSLGFSVVCPLAKVFLFPELPEGKGSISTSVSLKTDFSQGRWHFLEFSGLQPVSAYVDSQTRSFWSQTPGITWAPKAAGLKPLMGEGNFPANSSTSPALKVVLALLTESWE